MYSIFHPLDPNERLPRELIREGNRHRWVSGGWLFSLVGTFYLPGLLLAIIVLASLHVSPPLAFGIGGVGLVGVYAFTIWARTKP
jgi:hypothetical protein